MSQKGEAAEVGDAAVLPEGLQHEGLFVPSLRPGSVQGFRRSGGTLEAGQLDEPLAEGTDVEGVTGLRGERGMPGQSGRSSHASCAAPGRARKSLTGRTATGEDVQDCVSTEV